LLSFVPIGGLGAGHPLKVGIGNFVDLEFVLIGCVDIGASKMLFVQSIRENVMKKEMYAPNAPHSAAAMATQILDTDSRSMAQP
jgi:hypothetical protein